MKFVTLKTSAWINGVLRHPHEGAIQLTNSEADRLVKAETAEDVTDDFADEAKPAKAATVTADPVVAGDGNKKGADK